MDRLVATAAIFLCFALHGAQAGLYSEADDVIVHGSVEDFESEVLSGDQFHVVEFFANWCGGCRMVSPWYKQAATELKKEGIPLGAVDVDGPAGSLGGRYGVEGMPHIMAFIPGKKEPVGMGGLGGAESIVNFAREQWASLSAEQREAHGKARGLPVADYDVADPAADHRRQAIALDRAGDAAGALKSFRAAAKFMPATSANWNNLGIAVAEAADDAADESTKAALLAEARGHLKTALELDPKNEGALEMLAEIGGGDGATATTGDGSSGGGGGGESNSGGGGDGTVQTPEGVCAGLDGDVERFAECVVLVRFALSHGLKSSWTKGRGSWLGGNGDYCKWEGVVCNDRRKVKQLVLIAFGLSGTLDGVEELAELDELEDLVLMKNDIKGTLPSIWGLFPRLNYLGLDENDLSGTLPDSLGEMTGLTELILWGNRFEGSLPPSLGQLTRLTTLSLSANVLKGAGLVGTIPDLSALTHLEALYLQENKLSGTIPSTLSGLKAAKRVWLNRNELEGVVPDLSALKDLDMLHLEDNKLSMLPSSFCGFLPRECVLARNAFQCGAEGVDREALACAKDKCGLECEGSAEPSVGSDEL